MSKDNREKILVMSVGIVIVALIFSCIALSSATVAEAAVTKIQKVTVKVRCTCDNGVYATFQSSSTKYATAKNTAVKKAEKAAKNKSKAVVAKKYSYMKSIYKPGEPYEKANRRWVESRGDYKAIGGGGLYIGAYQAHKGYLPAWCKKAKVLWISQKDWLNSPEKQDKWSDWYAKSRYGGWKNVPWRGGW